MGMGLAWTYGATEGDDGKDDEQERKFKPSEAVEDGEKDDLYGQCDQKECDYCQTRAWVRVMGVLMIVMGVCLDRVALWCCRGRCAVGGGCIAGCNKRGRRGVRGEDVQRRGMKCSRKA